jgi:hypothetical protein
MSFFFFFSFFFYKIKEQEDGTGPAWGDGGIANREVLKRLSFPI